MRRMTLPAEELNTATLLITRTCAYCHNAYTVTVRIDRQRRDKICETCLANEQTDYELLAIIDRSYEPKEDE